MGLLPQPPNVDYAYDMLRFLAFVKQTFFIQHFI